MTPETLTWYQWLSQVGTNAWVGGFLYNNALLISGITSFGLMIFKFISKRTPGTADDELYAELEGAIRSKIDGIMAKSVSKK